MGNVGLAYKYVGEKDVFPELDKALTAFLVSKGWLCVASSALRTIPRQKLINAQALAEHRAQGAYQLANGAVYTGKGSSRKCWASPYGCSNHNYGAALDIPDKRFKGITNVELAKWGLVKPMDHEPWHVELIKTRSLDIEHLKVFYFQYTHGLAADGIAGPKTRAKMAELGVKQL